MLCFTDYYLAENDLGNDRSNVWATSPDGSSKVQAKRNGCDGKRWEKGILAGPVLLATDVLIIVSPAAVTDITGDSDGLKDPASP